MFDVRRRDVLTLLGGAAGAWPLGARAQHPKMLLAGFLVGASREGYAQTIASVRQGMSDAGFVEGRNVTIEYRWADNQYDKLPELAADLVRRQPAVIFVTGSVISAIAAKAATLTIPIVFTSGSDPIKYGLVGSLNRPGGNITGVSFFNSALGPKRLELLHEAMPTATVIAALINPKNTNAESDTASLRSAAQQLGLRLVVVNVSSGGEFDAAFATIVQQQAGALIVNNDALFQDRGEQIIAQATRHAVPTMFSSRRFAAFGAVITYGTNTSDMYREAGVYVGRVLKGTRPADLPVLLPTRFQLVVNLKTAKTLGLTISESFLLRADEVIE
jgi:putative ABC transport system substrate-binding protein